LVAVSLAEMAAKRAGQLAKERELNLELAGSLDPGG
jgi:hypothetical protein